MYPHQPPMLQPNSQFFQQALPMQPMMVPAVQVAAHMHPKVPMITGLVMLNLQTNSQRTPTRTFIFNMMSHNGYHNEAFGQLIQFITDLTDFMMQTQRMPEQVAITQAIEDGVTWTMAARVLQNHQQMQPYLDQQMVADFTAMAGTARQLQEQMVMFKNSQQVQGPPPQYGHGAQPMYGQGAPVYGQPAPGPMYGQPAPAPMYGHGVGGVVGAAYATAANAAADATAVPMRPSAYAGMTPRTPVAAAVAAAVATPITPQASSVNGGVVGRWAAATAEAEPEAPGLAHRPKQRMSWGVANPEPATVPYVAPEGSDKLPVAENAPPTVNRTMDETVVGDTIILPAYQNRDLSRSWTLDSPHGLAFDPVTHLMNYTINTTTQEVGQFLAPWSDDLDYMRHELDPKLIDKERKRREVMDGKVTSHTYHAVEMLKPNPDHFVSMLDDKGEIPAATEPYDLGRVEIYVGENGSYNLVASLVDGVRKVRRWLRDNERPAINKQSIEMYFDVPEVIYSPQIIVDGIRDLSSTQNFNDLFDVMEGAASFLDEESLFALDGRVVKLVNEALREGMGTGLRIDSFLGDWKELQGLLINQYGEELYRQLEEGASDYISAGLKVLNDEAAAEYLAAIDASYAEEQEAEAADEAAERAELPAPTESEAMQDLLAEEDEEDSEEDLEIPQRLVFIDRVSITTLPISREDMDLNLEYGALLSPEYLPQLHAGVQAILKRTADMPVAFRNRFLLTSDGKMVKITKSLLVTDTILLYDQQ